ncbi:MAG: DUF4386 family protein [Microthrixaceae bacterium]|nr:DUF4386 family protein [Microthrixaceae bacterium]
MTTTAPLTRPVPSSPSPAPADGPPRRRRLGRVAGVAALVEAATFVVGIALFVTVLADYGSGDLSVAESVRFLTDHQGALHLWYIVSYIAFGVALVPLSLGLHDRLRERAPELSRTAAAFGLIWAGLVLAAGMIANVGIGLVADLAGGADAAQAGALWSALEAVQDGLGGGNEVAGGVWVLLVSVAALRTRALPRGLNVLGIVSATAGIVTVVPGLTEVGMVFGLGLIVWFTWLGVVLVRDAR